MDAHGSPLPTFADVEVRGQKLTVATHSPVYVERSIDVVQGFVKELQADAAVNTTLESVTPVKAIQERNNLDELAALKCEGTPVEYAPQALVFRCLGRSTRDGVLPSPSAGVLSWQQSGSDRVGA